jgi:hypothetical protein
VKSGKKFLRCRLPPATRHDKPKPNTTIGYQAASHCPTCKSKKIYSHGTRSKTIIDWNKTLGRALHDPSATMPIMWKHLQVVGSSLDPRQYGWGLIAYAMYQNIELHLPQMSIDSSMSKLFGLRLPRGWTNRMKMAAAQPYAITHDRLVKKLCSGNLLHIDETSIRVRCASLISGFQAIRIVPRS